MYENEKKIEMVGLQLVFMRLIFVFDDDFRFIEKFK